jgi:hypothetical protein
MTRRLLFALFIAALLALNACSKKEEAPKPEAAPAPVPAPAAPPPPAPPPAGVTAAGIALGNAIGADKKVTQASETFGKKDTIYASVDTAGAGTATLRAKWTYHKGDKEAVVKEDSQTINPTGPATSEFHISKPDGWPAGQYQVEIWVDDKSAGTKGFSVK